LWNPVLASAISDYNIRNNNSIRKIVHKNKKIGEGKLARNMKKI